MYSDKQIPLDKPILLFDGVCNLCNGFVQFIIKIDPKGKFRFASLQSDVGQQLLQKHHIPSQELNTVVLIDGTRAYTHSDVPLRVSRHLGGFWSLFYVFKLLPRPIRNGIYTWIASNRYSWFGKKEECWLPTPDLKQRFLSS